MPEDENSEGNEFELMPISPLRRLEKRIEKLERIAGFQDKEFYRELVTIVRTNQQIVDELVKADNGLRVELSRCVQKIDDLIARLDEIISYVKESAYGLEETEKEPEKWKELMEINKKIMESNKAILASLEELVARIKAPLAPALRKPLFPKSV
jgi:site-specific recombinase